MKIEIVGNGSVGTALAQALNVTPLGPSEAKITSDVVIICVPTETISGSHDQTQVEQALGRITEAKLVILRSTVLPGTTDRLQQQSTFPLLFIPEFGFESTMLQDLAHPAFYIVGVTDQSRSLTELIPQCLPKATTYHMVRAISAEFAKYITNIWGCSQVALANSIYDWVMAQTGNGDIYTEAVDNAKLFTNLPAWGWKIHDQGFRGWGGKCLPKDLQAAISQYDHPLWLAFEAYNNQLRGKP